jgi:hypothetical protein
VPAVGVRCSYTSEGLCKEVALAELNSGLLLEVAPTELNSGLFLVDPAMEEEAEERDPDLLSSLRILCENFKRLRDAVLGEDPRCACAAPLITCMGWMRDDGRVGA